MEACCYKILEGLRLEILYGFVTIAVDVSPCRMSHNRHTKELVFSEGLAILELLSKDSIIATTIFKIILKPVLLRAPINKEVYQVVFLHFYQVLVVFDVLFDPAVSV